MLVEDGARTVFSVEKGIPRLFLQTRHLGILEVSGVSLSQCGFIGNFVGLTLRLIVATEFGILEPI